MNTQEIRQHLHQFIDEANDKKVEGLYQFLEDEINASQGFDLSQEQLIFLEKEKTMHLNEQSQSYTWAQAKSIIRKEEEK